MRWAGQARRLAPLGLAAALTALCLLVPSWTFTRDVYRHVIVLDITQSMNVADAPPGDGGRTRLEHAKSAALEALAALPCGSEAGIGLFTGHRTFLLFSPVEICAHYGDVATTVRAIDWRMAWAARSEVTKGVHSGLVVAAGLGESTSLVFLTDGHEAPPLHPELRPAYRGVPGAVRGVLVGIGDDTPMPIPKLDPDGRTRGVWQAQDVLQVDAFSMGRRASVADESMAGVESGDLEARIAGGREHLSSLREAHLRALAAELGLHYGRASSTADLLDLLRLPDLAIRRPARVDLRPALGLAALAVLLWAQFAPTFHVAWTKRRESRERRHPDHRIAHETPTNRSAIRGGGDARHSNDGTLINDSRAESRPPETQSADEAPHRRRG